MGKLKPQDPTLRLTTNIKGHPQLPSPDNTSLLIEKIEYRSSFHAERSKLLHYLVTISPDFNSSTAVYVSICRKSNRDLSRLVIPEIFYLSIHRKSNCGSSRLVIPEIFYFSIYWKSKIRLVKMIEKTKKQTLNYEKEEKLLLKFCFTRYAVSCTFFR